MQTITIITPSNTEVEYRLAGVGSRIAAFLFDFTLQIIAIVAIAMAVLIPGENYPSGTEIGFVMVSAFAIQVGYFVVWELAMDGQSVGKRLFGLRVLRDNGQPIMLWQAVVRGLLRSSVDMLYVGLFVIFFSKKHKRLGDMAAGTIVISERKIELHPISTGQDFRPVDYNDNGELDFLPDTFSLSGEERAVIEEWQRRKGNMTDGGKGIEGKLKDYFTEKYRMGYLQE